MVMIVMQWITRVIIENTWMIVVMMVIIMIMMMVCGIDIDDSS